jgi:hypothetical protein
VPIQVLDTWISGSLLPRTGSGELQGLLDLSLQHLARMGVKIPVNCRQRQALALLRRINTDRAILRPDNPTFLRRVESNWRTAWETILITHAAFERRRQRAKTPFGNQQLRRMLGGHELGDTASSTSPRDTQFELFVAALFAHTAVDVIGAEPDIRVSLGYERVGIAAKRVHSSNPKRIAERVKEALKQIRKSHLRGMLALNLDARLEGARLPPTSDERANLFAERLDVVLDYLQPCVQDQNVLGILIFAQCTQWTFPAGDAQVPTIDVSLPMRWLTWDDDPGMRILLDDYQRRWKSAVERNVADIVEGARRWVSQADAEKPHP